MKTPLRGGARRAARTVGLPAANLALAAALLASILLAACGVTQGSPSQPPSGIDASQALPSGTPAPTPTPSPLPTPSYTNPADPALVALIPTEVAGVEVVVPPVSDFAITPGDFGEAYGELGLRFASLQLAYVRQPRLSLYAARVSGAAVTTEELEPYLETAGRYVGIAGLVRDPWELKTIGDRVAWVRPEDNATVLGTMIYTWASDGYVFLMIGVDDTLNQAIFGELPGEAAPSPTPRPSRSPRSSPRSSASASPS